MQTHLQTSYLTTMDPALSPGLFDIHLSDSEDNNDDPAEGSSNSSASRTPADRTAQSEEEFRAVKAAYRVKVENGEVCMYAL